MINEFGAKNFFGFKDWAVVSCRLDGRVPEEFSNGLSASSVMGIKGGNASGKTNILKIFNFVKDFLLNGALVGDSSQPSESKKINVTSFFYSTDPSEFFIDFDSYGNNYLYELSVTNEEIIRESLNVTTPNKKIKVFERTRNSITVGKSFDELKKLKLGKNVSLIRQVANFNFNFNENYFKEVTNFLGMSWSNVDNEGIQREQSNDSVMIEFFSKQMALNADIKDFVIDIVKKSDLGVSNIVIEKNINAKGEDSFVPYFIHEHEGIENKLPFFLESNGTRKLFISLAYYWLALRSGGILLLDEFDIHLHPLILPTILNLFTNKESNPEKSQFIFTSHNTEIMDVLGKYRTVLVEKKDNESYCYRMDEIEGIRNDRDISGKYLKGIFGGVPDIV